VVNGKMIFEQHDERQNAEFKRYASDGEVEHDWGDSRN